MGAKETSPSLQIIKAGSCLLAYPVFRVGSIYNYVFYIVLYKLTDSTYGNDEKFSILMGNPKSLAAVQNLFCYNITYLSANLR